RKSPEITAAELTRSADTACHAAKEAGRNRVQHYRTDDKELMRRDDIMAWVTRLNDAMDENRVVLRCQRIERTDASGKPSYEVLIAITGDEGEMIAPSEFLRAAEQYNRMHTLDRWVLGNVFRWMHANSAVVQQLDHLSINLSGHSMNDANLGEYLFDLFERYPVPRDRLCFEVTETAAIANLEDAVDFITELQDMGCRFSLDDFGSGLASYGHLKSLPVDYIKIDGSFIRNVANDDADLALVRSINEMGHLMGKQTIAEYVENDEIRDCMAQIGVDYVQGYGVEKPRPLDTLVTDLAAPA
ncbi:MAG: EAL domain-containing protein, partial [Alcanivoracaceae bacterium]